MSNSLNITDRIERLASHEQRVGIVVDGLFAIQDENNFVVVNGEVRPQSGTSLNGDFCLTIDLIDENGRIIGKAEKHFFASSFLEFETFSLNLGQVEAEVSKIRIYPKLTE